jgi:hypothetical protein
VVAEFLAAREIRRLVDEAPDRVSPGDVAAAVNAYRSVFEFLRTAPHAAAFGLAFALA